MGGAASHDKQWRREGKTWWPEEMPSESEMEYCRASLDRVGWKVDYVVTHEAPVDLADELCMECNREFYDDSLQAFWASSTGDSTTAPGSLAITMTMNGATTSIA